MNRNNKIALAFFLLVAIVGSYFIYTKTTKETIDIPSNKLLHVDEEGVITPSDSLIKKIDALQTHIDNQTSIMNTQLQVSKIKVEKTLASHENDRKENDVKYYFTKIPNTFTTESYHGGSTKTIAQCAESALENNQHFFVQKYDKGYWCFLKTNGTSIKPHPGIDMYKSKFII